MTRLIPTVNISNQSPISSIGGGSSGVRGRVSSQGMYSPGMPSSLGGSSLLNTGSNGSEGESFYMKAHQRNINALSWSPHDSSCHTIATCSADGYVKVWDTRLNNSQCKVASFISYTDFPTLVCWNPIDSHIIASAHNVDVRIWDIRTSSSSTPSNKEVSFISAHHPLVASVDWSPTNSHELVTAGTDKTIKVWDYQQQQTLMSQRVTLPVWKIRYTPFGKGLVSISKKDTQVRLWKLNYPKKTDSMGRKLFGSPSNSVGGVEPIENISLFSGHTDEIRCFDFRTVEGTTQHQLVTWSKDLSVRCWNFTPQMMEDFTTDSNMGSPSNSKDNSLEPGSFERSINLAKSPIGLMSSHLLGNEWSITSVPDHIFETDPSALFESLGDGYSGGISSPTVSLSFDNEMEKLVSVFNNMKFCTRSKINDKSENIECELKLTIEKMDKKDQARFCILSMILIIRPAQQNTILATNELRLKITFPKLYPINAAPSFDFLPTRSFISVQDLKTIKQSLTTNSHDDVLKHRNCMLSCLKSLLSILGKMRWRERKDNEQDGVAIIGATMNTTGLPKVSSVANMNTTPVEEHEETSAFDKGEESVPVPTKQVVSKNENTFIAPPVCGARFSPNGDLIYFNSFSHKTISKKSVDSKKTSSMKKKPVEKSVDFGYRYYTELIADIKTPFFLTEGRRNTEDGDKRKKKNQKKEKKEIRSTVNTSTTSNNSATQDLNSKQSDLDDLMAPGTIKDVDDTTPKEVDNNYFSSVYNEYHDETTEDDSDISSTGYEDDYMLGDDQHHAAQFYGNHNYIGEIDEHGEDQHFLGENKPFVSINDTRTDPRIHIYDSKFLLPVSYSLAVQYRVVGSSAVDLCLHNSAVCLSEGRPDLWKMWRVLSQIVDPRLFLTTGERKTTEPSLIWTHHALGRRFVKKVLNHFLKKHDIQTCAIISCVLQLALSIISSEIKSTTNQSQNHPLLSEISSRSKPHDFIPIDTKNRENLIPSSVETIESCDLLEREIRPVMAHVRMCYAKLLQSWGLHMQRCEIMKYNVSQQATQRFMNGTSGCVINIESSTSTPSVSTSSQEPTTTTTTSTPKRSGSLIRENPSPPSAQSAQSRTSCISCTVCRIPVKGLVAYCPNCGHGGHIQHIQKWFENHATCPAGCSCKCTQYMVSYPVSQPPPKVLTIDPNVTTYGSNASTYSPYTMAGVSLTKPSTRNHSSSTPNMQNVLKASTTEPSGVLSFFNNSFL